MRKRWRAILELFKNNYKVIEFPACTTDYKEYIKKHSKGIPLKHYNNTCESEGVTLRLNPKSSLLTDLNKSENHFKRRSPKTGAPNGLWGPDNPSQRRQTDLRASPKWAPGLPRTPTRSTSRLRAQPPSRSREPRTRKPQFSLRKSWIFDAE